MMKVVAFKFKGDFLVNNLLAKYIFTFTFLIQSWPGTLSEYFYNRTIR